MFCFFCKTKTAHSQELCCSCFDKAFKTAKEYYQTNDIHLMMSQAQMGDEGDAMTFQFESQKKADLHDLTGGEFVIDKYESITELCKYDHILWPDFFPGWIDLSTGDRSGFWRQCIFPEL